MKLIDKAAIVAEIENLLDKGRHYAAYECAYRDGNNAALYALKGKLDALDMKEVEDVPVSDDLEEAIGKSFIYHENHGDDFRSDKQIETAYRCGFETCAKYKELTLTIIEDIKKQRLEMKDLDLDKKIKDYFDNQPIITRSEGVDYQLIPSGEAIARHFFELGLKTQKKEQL